MEVLAGAGMYWNQNRPVLNLMRCEEICEVELVPKTAVDSTNAADAGKAEDASSVGDAIAAKEQDIYGIRLDLQALEVQFYHRKDLVQ